MITTENTEEMRTENTESEYLMKHITSESEISITKSAVSSVWFFSALSVVSKNC